jgi:glycerophosphoryl diester phosphodiesterase
LAGVGLWHTFLHVNIQHTYLVGFEAAMLHPVFVTAHRGSSGSLPENTLAAFRQAIEDGSDFIELDIQESADGELVVFHDDDLMRVAKRPETIGQLPWKTLQCLDVGSWFNPQYHLLRMPSLAQVLPALCGKIKLNLEIKKYHDLPRFVKQLTKYIQAQAMASDCLFSSVQGLVLAELKRQAPHFACGRIFETSLVAWDDPNMDFISINNGCLSLSLIQTAHALGKPVHVWTVNEPLAMDQCVAWGVDNIITDFPLRLRQLLLSQA